MHLLLYLGPACLVGAIVMAATGRDDAAQAAILGWLVFTFLGVIVRPRTRPEAAMTLINALLFVVAVGAALLGVR